MILISVFLNVLSMKGKLNGLTFKPFHTAGLFLYPLKTSKNQRFLMFPGGIERDLGMKWVKKVNRNRLS